MPADHPLRPIRQWLNDALAKMGVRFSSMYEADVKVGRPSIAPGWPSRTACGITPSTAKNRDRLIEHDAVTELFNATVEMAEQRG